MSLLPRRRREDMLPMAHFGREMANLFDDFFGAWPRMAEDVGFMERFPALDIKENGDSVEVVAEVPGMKPEDLDINVVGNILTIRGEKKEEKEDTSKSVHRIERRYGRFERQVQLPTEVDINKTDAKYRDGILTIKLSKRADAIEKTRKIEIKKE